ncbi:MAG: chalcone isomerase family protein [Pseudomonadota bacterium]
MKVVLVAAVFLGLINSALAASVDESKADWRVWPKVGEAQLSMLFFDIYHSRLLSPTGQYQLEEDVTPHPLALSITYQRDISQQQLLDATIEQWQKLGYNPQQIEPWAKQLASVFPNIEEGTNLTYVTDGKTGRFYYFKNSSEGQIGVSPQQIGNIDDESFNDAFVSIWLAPNTEYPKLRSQLIGSR